MPPFRKPLSERTAILLLLLFAVALILPAAYLGLPENYDLGQHLRFARTWHDEMASGNLIPLWGAADNAGLGSAGVRFYPPATHFMMGVIQFATGSWYDTLWITLLIWMFIGSIGVFRLASEWSSSTVALTSALLYAIVPYHLMQVFQMFLLAEFIAAAIIPFCFLYAHRLITEGGTTNILLFSIAYSGLVLTHIPMTIIGTLSLGVFLLTFVSAENFRRLIYRFVPAFTISLIATAFYWVRMVTEISWIKHNTPEYYATGPYNYSTYLFPILYSAGEAYLPRLLWLIDVCIVATFVLFIPPLFVAISKKFKAQRHLTALLTVAGCSLFMMSILSTPIWDNVSLIQKLQFPYRWLVPASLAAALSFPIAVAALAEGRAELSRAFAYPLLSILIVVIVFDVSQVIVPSAPVPRAEFERSVEKLDQEPACDCWWPMWASRDVMKNSERIFAGGRGFSISRWASTERKFTVESGTSETVRIGTFFYPHWIASVNGLPTEVSKDSNGLIEIPIPTGTAEVTLEFREPRVVIWSRFASGAAICAIFLLFLFTTIRSRNP